MDKQSDHKQQRKYVPPHRRTQPPSSEASGSQAHGSYTYSRHARLRQQQREISGSQVATTVDQGEKLPQKSADIFIDRSHVVVMSSGKNKNVVTVFENKRNTRFDKSYVNKQREKVLLRKIQAEKRNDHALCELAEMYLSGVLGNRNIAEAHKLLLQAANQGSSHAMCLLADLEESGDLGTEDSEAALEWLIKAAGCGNRYANAVLGQKLLAEFLELDNDQRQSDVGQEKIRLAKKYLNKSANKGATRAQWQIAEMHEQGWGYERDLTKAIKLYSEAAKSGSPTSLDSLQRHVDEGNFTVQALESILDVASKHVAKTSSGIAIDIALKQLTGQLGVKPQRGLKMLKTASENNNSDAMRHLARCLRDGFGCEPNLQEAQYWFVRLRDLLSQSIQQGNNDALIELTDLMRQGEGQIDVDAVESHLISFAQQGVTNIMYRLALLYLEGQLGDRDPQQGMIWMNKVIELWEEQARSDDSLATFELLALYLNKELPFKDYTKAKQWLLFLVQKQDEELFALLALLFFKNKISFTEEEVAFLSTIYAEQQHPVVRLMLIKLADDDSVIANKLALCAISNNVEDELQHKAQNDEHTALLLSFLYQKAIIFQRNLHLEAKFIFLATRSDIAWANKLANQELDRVLSNDCISPEDKSAIVTGLESLSDEITPFRLGRVLGDIYFEGRVVERDVASAFNWYLKSADLGNNMAMFQLSVIYFQGLLGEIELDKAVDWLKRSVSVTTVDKIYALLHTENVAQEIKDTAKICLDAYRKGKDIYCRSSHEMYECGKQLRSTDVNLSALWFRLAAEREHAEAAFDLANLLRAGALGGALRPVAVRYFKQAAKRQHKGAIQAMVTLFTEGQLVAPDHKKAAKWAARLSL